MSEEKGLLSRAIETVSETVKGTAEGLQHGTRLMTGQAVAAKESTREGMHQMTGRPSESEPSYLDQSKEQIKEKTREAQEKLHQVGGDGSERSKHPVKRSGYHVVDDPSYPTGTKLHPDDPRYYQQTPTERFHEPKMQPDPSPSLGERIKATFVDAGAKDSSEGDPTIADPYIPKRR